MSFFLTVVSDAVRRFFRNGGFILAAAVAFFASISVFPLLMLGFAILLLIVRAGVAKPAILAIADQLVPNGSTFMLELIEERTSVLNEGVIGIVILVYAGMAVFGALQFALDTAFESKKPRSYKRFLLTAFVMAITTGFIVVASGFFRIGIGIIDRAVERLYPSLSLLLNILSGTITFAAFFAIITLIFTVVPRDRPSFADVWPGALFASIAVFIAQLIFSIWLRYTELRLVFGSLTAIIALLIWLDVTALLIILGAEIAASWMALRKRGGP